MKKVYFRQRVVRKVLLVFKIHKAAGPDGISSFVLKNCAAIFSAVILSYSKRICPLSWRFVNIIPGSQQGSSLDPSSYDIITITSILCKVMEKIINRKLKSFFESKNFDIFNS